MGAPLVVVMGVGGAGKTTVGILLADRLGLCYADADSFHPSANVAKMSAGKPLDDADREPWLRAIARHLSSLRQAGDGGVVSSSALKRAYRDVLRVTSDVFFVYLDGKPEVVRSRLRARTGHFFSAALLDSQYAILEPLQPDEVGLRVDITRSPADIVNTVVRALGR